MSRARRISICLPVFAAFLTFTTSANAIDGPVGPLDLVYVSDDDAELAPGCDALSVVNARSGTAIVRGDRRSSVQRMTLSADGGLLVSPLFGDPKSVYVLRRSANDPGEWTTRIQAVSGLVEGGPIAFALHDTAILLTLDGSLGKFAVTDLKSARMMFPQGKYGSGSWRPSTITMTADSRTALVTDTDGHIHSIDVSTMSRRSDPIPYEPPSTGKGSWRGQMRRTFAHLSPDGQFLAVNGGYRGGLTVVNLVSRAVFSVPTAGLSETWGLAFNYAAPNYGLLAIHGRNRVAVYEFLGESEPRILESIEVPPQIPSSYPYDPVFLPRFSVLAWTGLGDGLVVSVNHKQEFRVLDFRQYDSPRLIPRLDFDGCTANRALGGGNDVVTLNRRLVPPTPSPSPVPSATETPRDATLTPSPTVTPSSTPTVANSATPTRAPQPIYLPLLLKEDCDPTQLQADVALVIDASTSMLEETREKRTKLAAAVEAVELFLGELNLPLDQAAVVQFNGDVELLQELTGDRGALVESLDRIQVKRQTRIDLGIQVAREELKGSRRRVGNQAVMIVLTDGRANPVGPDAAVREAEVAQSEGVTVFTIGLGEDLNLEALEAMASKPSYFYRAPDAEDLADIYSKIAVEIPCPATDFWGQR